MLLWRDVKTHSVFCIWKKSLFSSALPFTRYSTILQPNKFRNWYLLSSRMLWHLALHLWTKSSSPFHSRQRVRISKEDLLFAVTGVASHHPLPPLASYTKRRITEREEGEAAVIVIFSYSKVKKIQTSKNMLFFFIVATAVDTLNRSHYTMGLKHNGAPSVNVIYRGRSHDGSEISIWKKHVCGFSSEQSMVLKLNEWLKEKKISRVSVKIRWRCIYVSRIKWYKLNPLCAEGYFYSIL